MIKRLMLKGIRFYRMIRREVAHNTTPHCRYIPTCSQYAQTAIQRYGAWKGGWMAVWRVLRCNPFSKGGYDPVPEDPYISLRRE